MRAVIQRVSRASVRIQEETVAEISVGLLVLLAVANGDGREQAAWLAEKISGLRIFPDSDGKMNLDIRQIKGEALIVSQFTLYGECRKGKRPSYTDSAPPEAAEALYHAFIQAVAEGGIPVQTGRFGAMMQVALVNDGPVTLILDAPKPIMK